MRQRIQLISIDHSITFAVILFVFILFSAIQIIAQEKKENKKIDSPANIENPNSTQTLNDKIEFKNGPSSSILTITDEGSNAGSITLPNVGATRTGNKLYNNGGILYWGNSPLGASSGNDNDWEVSTNITRLFNETHSVGIGTPVGYSEAKFMVLGNNGVLFQGTFGNGLTSSLQSGTRFHFYSRKAATRSGYVNGTQWDDANIGNYSTAFGLNTTASGDRSFAAGNNAIASALDAVAFGKDTKASGSTSVAMGIKSTASGIHSTALGLATNAESYASFAVGINNVGGGSATSWNLTDPIFEIGNADPNTVNPSNAMTVLKNGNVGLGTISPSYKLALDGGSGSNSVFSIFQNDDTGTGGLRIGINSFEQADFLMTMQRDMRFFTNNTVRINIAGNGNINLKGNTTIEGTAKIGASGTEITEILEITGTTDDNDNDTDVSYPSGFNKNNTHVLSCKVQRDGDEWDLIGYVVTGPEDVRYQIDIDLDDTKMILRVPGVTTIWETYRNQPYKIVVMRMD